MLSQYPPITSPSQKDKDKKGGKKDKKKEDKKEKEKEKEKKKEKTLSPDPTSAKDKGIKSPFKGMLRDKKAPSLSANALDLQDTRAHTPSPRREREPEDGDAVDEEDERRSVDSAMRKIERDQDRGKEKKDKNPFRFFKK